MSKIDFNGVQTSYHYDEHIRLIKADYSDGSIETIEYNASGNRVRFTQSEPHGDSKVIR